MDVFNSTDYKYFLREALHEKRRQVNASFTYERMARACGINKTYLSRVLNSEAAHLSEEQLYLAATYLGLDSEQQDYIQILRGLQKSSNAHYRDRLQKKLDMMRSAHQRSESHLSAEKTDANTDLSPYYLDPNVMLTHVFLAVERFRKDVKSLALQLNLSDEYLAQILTKLEQMKFIQFTKDGYAMLKESTHLPVDSPLYYPYRFMQRVKSLERIQKISRETSYNFSVVFSADEQARWQIKAKFLEFLEFVSKVSDAAEDQEVYQMNFDLFDWST